MNKCKYAVIDLGTNTFHLLIIESSPNGKFKELYRERIFVKLAEGGIKKISALAFDRALHAMQHYAVILKEHKAEQVNAFGTAALRTSSNGAEFIHQVFEKTGIKINIISGKEEARLIHKGVMQTVALDQKQAVIMDIGGGSVEFILANGQEIFWSGSFPIGVAVLKNSFHKNDPITKQEIESINNHLTENLNEMLQAFQQFNPTYLIGASGTFDVLENFFGKKLENGLTAQVSISAFESFYEQLLFSTNDKRIQMEKLPNSRADMIVVALILIKYVVDALDFKDILVSSYAMKEGILLEMQET